jgi:hypothetical protein
VQIYETKARTTSGIALTGRIHVYIIRCVRSKNSLNPEGKRPFDRPKNRCPDNIKMDLNKYYLRMWHGII